MHNPSDHIDAAQTCAAQLHAIEDLLAQLLSGILAQLDIALREISACLRRRGGPVLKTF